jgi:toxin ParE1/3/4
MPRFKYSKVARLELLDITEYTRKQWGDAQARSYLDSLEATFDLLAQYPLMGRVFSSRFRQWRRFEHASHVILYQPIPSGIRIIRLLHKRQTVNPI